MTIIDWLSKRRDFAHRKKKIETAIGEMSDFRTFKREIGIRRLKNKPPDEVIAILKENIRSDDAIIRADAITALGELGYRYGWEEVVPILEKIIISKYKEGISSQHEDMSGKAIDALDKATLNWSDSPLKSKDCMVNPRLRASMKESVNRIGEILRKTAVKDGEHSYAAKALLETFKPEFLAQTVKAKEQTVKAKEIERLGEKNYRILCEAREAAKAAMAGVPPDDSALLLRYMKVISKLGEEWINNLHSGLNEEHILMAGAKAFRSILEKYNIESSVESLLD